MFPMVQAEGGVPRPVWAKGLPSSRGQATLALSGMVPGRVLFEFPFLKGATE